MSTPNAVRPTTSEDKATIERMAQGLAHALLTNACCGERDLLQLGFTETEIKSHHATAMQIARTDPRVAEVLAGDHDFRFTLEVATDPALA